MRVWLQVHKDKGRLGLKQLRQNGAVLFPGCSLSVTRQLLSTTANIVIPTYFADKWGMNDGVAKAKALAVVSPFISFTSAAMFVPLETMKIRLQADAAFSPKDRRYNAGLPKAYSSFVGKYGVRALWTGGLPNIMRTTACWATLTPSYKLTKTVLLHFAEEREWARQTFQKGSTFVHITASVVSSFLATLASQPFDVIKTKIQNQSQTAMKKKYRGFGHCAKILYKSGGVKPFMDGFIPRLIRMEAWMLLFWVSYENILEQVAGQHF